MTTFVSSWKLALLPTTPCHFRTWARKRRCTCLGSMPIKKGKLRQPRCIQEGLTSIRAIRFRINLWWMPCSTIMQLFRPIIRITVITLPILCTPLSSGWAMTSIFESLKNINGCREWKVTSKPITTMLGTTTPTLP